MRKAGLGPAGELKRRMSFLAMWKLRRTAASNGRQSLLPVGGITPAVDMIHALASAAAAQHAGGARAEADALLVEFAFLRSALTAAEERVKEMRSELETLPARPNMDNVPPRALTGNERLVHALTYAKARTELETARSACEQRLRQFTASRDGLLARSAAIPAETEAILARARAETSQSAAEANRRIAYYTVVFTRHHRDRPALAQLLPLKRVTADELLVNLLPPVPA